MRCKMVALAAALLVSPASAAPKPAAYYPAEDFFNSVYTLRERVVAQVLLIAAGYQNAVPTDRLQTTTFNATRDFQASNGLAATGRLDRATYDRLFSETKPLFRIWDFREIAHPVRGRAIWMPQGMDLRPIANSNGLSFRDPAERLEIHYSAIPNTFIGDNYEDLLRSMRAKGARVHYAVMKDDWFVISSTSAQGIDAYRRYHVDGSGLLGFTAYWNNAYGSISGERVAILMSASLGASFLGRPFVEPPNFGSGSSVAAASPVKPLRSDPDTVAPPPPSVSPPAPVPPVKSEEKISIGSGFFVDENGRFVTNAHVIKECNKVVVKTTDGQMHKASVEGTDGTNDLALLQVGGAQGHRSATLRYGTRLGEDIATFGFPHIDMLASGGNFTLGNVTALAGISDDSRFYQISAPVQQGNSGGPLLDRYGNVTGVVTAKLDVLKLAMRSGDFPQNVNFAIKGMHLASFLETNGVSIAQGNTTGQKLDAADLADLAKAVSGLVVCQ